MFDSLQDRFQKVFKTLRIQGVLTPEAVDETWREVRLALLEADVNLNLVNVLLERVRVKAMDGLTLDVEPIRLSGEGANPGSRLRGNDRKGFVTLSYERP